jgi:hypothetical protein
MPRFLARKRVRKSGETVTYYFWDGRRARLKEVSLGTDYDQAVLLWKQCEAGMPPDTRAARRLLPPLKTGKRRKLPEVWHGMPDWCKTMFLNAERRAKGRRPFTLAPTDLHAIWKRSGGRCEVSGIPFDLEAADSRIKRPFAPSIDRIDSRMGYQPGNVRLVCMMVNFAMSSWGEEPLRKLVRAMAPQV